MRLQAFAKINLGLDVLGKREDGYHEVRMIMQTIRMYDQLDMRKSVEPGIHLTTNKKYIPVDENNLVWRAAKLMMDTCGIMEGVSIHLHKVIPVAAGLAGGSSDAAATLVGMNRLFHCGLSKEKLMELGVQIGADVPYCVLRGTALAEGIGEKLTVLPPMPDCWILIGKPGISVSTKYVYTTLDLNTDTVHPDIDGMKKALEERGFANVYVMPNFKDLHILNESELIYHHTEPYPLCTFSRVMKEKGIEDAVNAVKRVNEQCGRTVYTLDIYGQVDSSQTEWFEELKNQFPPYIRYGGLVPFDQSVEALKPYFALLFPTVFFTEGIPGTIIDAYAAGVPVISSKWESFSDVIDDEITGIGYAFGDFDELCTVLKNAVTNPQLIQQMKCACIEKAKKYTPEAAMKVLVGEREIL